MTAPNKKRAHCAHRFPSFVYRQDGHELSYEVGIIILPLGMKVNVNLGVRNWELASILAHSQLLIPYPFPRKATRTCASAPSPSPVIFSL